MPNWTFNRQTFNLQQLLCRLPLQLLCRLPLRTAVFHGFQERGTESPLPVDPGLAESETEMWTDISQELLNGVDPESICDRYGIRQDSLAAIIKAFNLPVQLRRRTLQEQFAAIPHKLRRQIAQDYSNGVPVDTIVKNYRIPQAVVYLIADEFEVPYTEQRRQLRRQRLPRQAQPPPLQEQQKYFQQHLTIREIAEAWRTTPWAVNQAWHEWEARFPCPAGPLSPTEQGNAVSAAYRHGKRPSSIAEDLGLEEWVVKRMLEERRLLAKRPRQTPTSQPKDTPSQRWHGSPYSGWLWGDAVEGVSLVGPRLRRQIENGRVRGFADLPSAVQREIRRRLQISQQ